MRRFNPPKAPKPVPERKTHDATVTCPHCRRTAVIKRSNSKLGMIAKLTCPNCKGQFKQAAAVKGVT